MPTTVADAFAAAELARDAVLRWGTPPPTKKPGVYVVSLTEAVDSLEGTLPTAPLAMDVFETWLQVRPELTLDGARPTSGQLMQRIQGFWLPDEVILYVGLATNLSSRVGQYYRTPIGARRPHAGGYFLKLLSNLGALWVHYAACLDPAGAEDAMLRRFCESVSDSTRSTMMDPDHPFPFANLQWPPGIKKAHGILGAREPRAPSPSKTSQQATSEALRPPVNVAVGRHPTQRVTLNDLRRGHVRIPATGTASTKSLFPATKAQLDVRLRGRTIRGSWDPRMGPDQERSGVLRVGSDLREVVQENEVLTVTTDAAGMISLG